MANRLAGETSPYLLQHKDNPVDWYPWGEEAFAKARAENKPVFLSVGYSSCHWCHVMEHESFEDLEVADILNRHFVSVKVDREERPDVDEAYMTAVQLSSGRGGWPMSAFLTPDRKPFFAGTYFPKDDRGEYPGFKTILRQLAQAWATRRAEIERTADQFAAALKETLSRRPPGTFTPLDERFLENAVRAAAAEYDPQHGGARGAPKFPPHSGIEFLLAYAIREQAPQDLAEAAVTMALQTLEKMCLGGLHDHVGGGFHRYSTDEKWLLPHFEKMLYDNALMLGNLARAGAVAAHLDPGLEALFHRAAVGVVGWAAREMASPAGLFYSALDADSEGVEGKFYVWTEDEVRSVLGDRATAFMQAYRVWPDGNYYDEATHQKTGANILHLEGDDQGQFAKELEALRLARESRVRPGLDDKALVSWNGLMIAALAEVGAISLAERAAKALLEAERTAGALPHQVVGGAPAGAAFLDDYAFFALGLFTLAEIRAHLESDPNLLAESRADVDWTAADWRREAERLTGDMVARFYDDAAGGFFMTAEGHEELFGRSKPVFDHPVPSGNAAAIRCLLRAGDTDRARRSLEAFAGWMERVPQSTEALHLAALELFALAPAPASPPAQGEKPVVLPKGEIPVTLEAKELRAGVDGTAQGRVLIEVPAGLHLNAPDPPARWLVPTRVEVKPLEAVVHYPEAAEDRYEGTVAIPFTVRLPEGEDGADLEVRVSFQACTESECLLPQERTFTGVVLR